MKKEEIFSIPNIMSFLRFLLIPLFLYFYFTVERSSTHLISTGILIFSSITDGLDGYIARHYHMVTELGKVLDPIADKFNQFVLACVLMTTYPLFALVLVIIIMEDSLLLFGGYYIYDVTKRHLGQAHLPGKIATAVYFVFSIILVAFDLSSSSLSLLMILSMAALMFYAMVYYGMGLWTLYFHGEDA